LPGAAPGMRGFRSLARRKARIPEGIGSLTTELG